MATSVNTSPGPATGWERSALRRAKVKKPELIWDGVERLGFDRIAKTSGLAPRRLREFLALYEPAERKDFGIWRRHGLELLVAAVILAFVASAFVALQGEPQVIVHSPKGLLPLSVVQVEDLAVERRARVPGGFRDPADVVGRLVLQRLPMGVVIGEDQLAPRPEATAPGLRTLAVPVQLATLRGVTAGQRITLLLAPRSIADGLPRAGTTLPDVLVIAVVREPPATLVVAVGEADLALLARELGASDVYVAR